MSRATAGTETLFLFHLTVPSRASLELFGTGPPWWPSTPKTEKSMTRVQNLMGLEIIIETDHIKGVYILKKEKWAGTEWILHLLWGFHQFPCDATTGTRLCWPPSWPPTAHTCWTRSCTTRNSIQVLIKMHFFNYHAYLVRKIMESFCLPRLRTALFCAWWASLQPVWWVLLKIVIKHMKHYESNSENTYFIKMRCCISASSIIRREGSP